MLVNIPGVPCVGNVPVQLQPVASVTRRDGIPAGDGVD
jgi:hypothetical protein